MASQTNPDHLVGVLRDTVVTLVRRDGPDLSSRQLGVFLTVYLGPGPHTVRGLAERLGVSKPVVTRALNKLTALGYLQRKRDRNDGRNIFVEMTRPGADFLERFNQLIGEAEGRARTG